MIHRNFKSNHFLLHSSGPQRALMEKPIPSKGMKMLNSELTHAIFKFKKAHLISCFSSTYQLGAAKFSETILPEEETSGVRRKFNIIIPSPFGTHITFTFISSAFIRGDVYIRPFNIFFLFLARYITL